LFLFLHREEGQGLAEYALILSLIAILAVAALLFFGGNLNSEISPLGQHLGTSRAGVRRAAQAAAFLVSEAPAGTSAPPGPGPRMRLYGAPDPPEHGAQLLTDRRLKPPCNWMTASPMIRQPSPTPPRFLPCRHGKAAGRPRADERRRARGSPARQVDPGAGAARRAGSDRLGRRPRWRRRSRGRGRRPRLLAGGPWHSVGPPRPDRAPAGNAEAHRRRGRLMLGPGEAAWNRANLPGYRRCSCEPLSRSSRAAISGCLCPSERRAEEQRRRRRHPLARACLARLR